MWWQWEKGTLKPVTLTNWVSHGKEDQESKWWQSLRSSQPWDRVPASSLHPQTAVSPSVCHHLLQTQNMHWGGKTGWWGRSDWLSRALYWHGGYRSLELSKELNDPWRRGILSQLVIKEAHCFSWRGSQVLSKILKVVRNKTADDWLRRQRENWDQAKNYFLHSFSCRLVFGF